MGEISVLPLLVVIVVVAATFAGLGFVLGGHFRVPCLLVGDLEKRVKAGKIEEDLSGTKGCFFFFPFPRSTLRRPQLVLGTAICNILFSLIIR